MKFLFFLLLSLLASVASPFSVYYNIYYTQTYTWTHIIHPAVTSIHSTFFHPPSSSLSPLLSPCYSVLVPPSVACRATSLSHTAPAQVVGFPPHSQVFLPDLKFLDQQLVLLQHLPQCLWSNLPSPDKFPHPSCLLQWLAAQPCYRPTLRQMSTSA